MSNSVALSVIRLGAKRRADMENSSFVSDSEWLTMINASCGEFYDLLISNFEQDYVLSTQSVSVVAGTDTYALASDFYKLLGVDVLYGSDYYPVKRFQFRHRHKPSSSASSGRNLQYRLRGSTIWFAPVPATTETIRIYYVPLFTALSVDADTFEFHGAGWEEYVIVDAAIKALRKEESDTSFLISEKLALRQRIEEAAPTRESNEPEQVVDVSRRNYGIYYDSDYTYF